MCSYLPVKIVYILLSVEPGIITMEMEETGLGKFPEELGMNDNGQMN